MLQAQFLRAANHLFYFSVIAKRPGFSLLSEVEVVTKRINTSSLGGPLLPEWNVGLWKPPGEHGHALCRVSLECVFGSQ
jgi:hypothetical protein